ncbi:MAG TPA: hypothetical protein PKO47_01120 [bacterium]|nr:hypothetical protein [bacterium]HNL25360.1 hypothetical protein [bacterium]
MIIMFSVLCSCNDAPEGSPYLDKDYNYIVGILVPDSFRTYRQEIFVGKMLDILVHSNEVDTAQYGEDPVLHIQNLVTWHDYRGKIVGTTGASVEVIDITDNESVTFQDIGNGIYRDVNEQLHVHPLHRYSLKVTTTEKAFTAETTVPGDFQISNINEDDTLTVVAIKRSYYYSANYPPYWTSSQGKFFYRTDHLTSQFFINFINHVYEPPGFFTVTPDTVNYQLPFIFSGWIQVMALDTNYGRMYSPEETSTAPIDLLTYISNQETTPLPERTNIKGKEAVGVFGSLNRTKRVNFYMKVVK